MYWEEIVWLYEAPTHRHQKAEYPATKTIACKIYIMKEKNPNVEQSPCAPHLTDEWSMRVILAEL